MFWIFILLMNLMIPIMMLLFGQLFEKHTPKSINKFYGYRTRMSMMNNETWEYAHKLCGKLWSKLGWILLVVTLAVMLPLKNRDIEAIGNLSLIIVIIQLIVIISSMYMVEKALRKNFDREGKRII